MVEQIRIDLRNHVECNSVLQRKQIVQMPVETSAPQHLEIQHDIQQGDVYVDLVAEHMDRAVDDVVQLVGPATRHRIDGGSGTIPERRGGNKTGRAEAAQGSRDLLGHTKRYAMADRRADAAERQNGHPPAELVPPRLRQSRQNSPARHDLR